MKVPMVDLQAQLLRIRPEVDAALARVLDSTRFIGGEECAGLEQEFAAYCGVTQACGVANGTDALILALRAYGVGPGDEVVTVANTFIA
ncbi:MAG TPA: DegT/DnrJ/EryC1/StrS family aminotransferase, partial [Vicinamibacteria bacterium]